MRTLLKITFPNETMNQLVTSGKIGELMERRLSELKPEASYFTTNEEGERCSFIVIDLKDPSELPRIAEPFFIEFNARLTASPVMNVEDLKKGLGSLRGLVAAGRG